MFEKGFYDCGFGKFAEIMGFFPEMFIAGKGIFCPNIAVMKITSIVELILGFSNILQIFTENTFHYLDDNLAFTVNLALCIKLFTAS